MALAHLWQAGIDWEIEFPAVEAICSSERSLLHGMITNRINSPLTSSMGRLFDAASALVGVRQEATYEGQAAIEFEMLADHNERGAYEFEITKDIFDPAPVWHAMLSDWRRGVGLPVISARFHNGVAQLALSVCEKIRANTGVNTVALSGGVWQNRFLLEQSLQRLRSSHFNVLIHRQVPANDGGIALGQIMIAAQALKQ
jgi:hydrogenase maturation protein HypF